MKKIKFATRIFIALLLFFIVYNTYFGWNKFPESDMEEFFDHIFHTGTYLAWAIFLLPLADVYSDFIKRFEEKKGKSETPTTIFWVSFRTENGCSDRSQLFHEHKTNQDFMNWINEARKNVEEVNKSHAAIINCGII